VSIFPVGVGFGLAAAAGLCIPMGVVSSASAAPGAPPDLPFAAGPGGEGATGAIGATGGAAGGFSAGGFAARGFTRGDSGGAAGALPPPSSETFLPQAGQVMAREPTREPLSVCSGISIPQ
jgi:hypothetical protein